MEMNDSLTKLRRHGSLILLLTALATLTGCARNKPPFQIQRTSDDLTIRTPAGQPILTYNVHPPTNAGLAVNSGDYFHPIRTPAGLVITDFAPSDHRHHRGLFLGFVEMHGGKDADFWGWGEHAPIKNRRIVTRPIFDSGADAKDASFVSVSDWTAEETVLLEENLRSTARRIDSANVIDAIYSLTARTNITLARWAFSGFCLRTRKDGEIRFESPRGVVSLPNPNHLKPETDWPNEAWYAVSLKLKEQATFGAAVINHPRNPPTLWHNHRDVRMINPCIVAPGEVRLSATKPLVLRYRVVAFDGEVPRKLLDKLAREFARK